MLSHRWAQILVGVFDLILGLFMLYKPFTTINFAVILFSIYAILYGVFILIAAFSDRIAEERFRWWLAIGGGLSLLAGTAALIYPIATVIILIYFVSFRAIFVGVFELAASIQLRKVIKDEFLLGLVGAVNVIFGVFLLFYPLVSVLTLVLFIGWYLIIVGGLLLIRGIFFSKREVIE
jgi:uncharacterized membrane protein HdeD (DUF308 family)